MKKLSAKKTAALVIGAAMCAAGLAAWIYQLVQGMQVTNLRNSFTWGLYMGSFEFFIAMATGGILVFSIAYLWNIETLKPFVKIASIGSLACVVAAGVAIFEDLGEPFHALYMIITPNVGSPLFWDVVILTLYVIVCLVAVVLTLLPDTKKHVHDRGYRMTNEENCRRFSFIAFPMAFLLNIITSFMFATQNTREWWHSALIPVNACAEATAVGLSFTILLCVLMVRHEIFVENSDGIRLLSRIAAASIAAYIVMSFIEIVPLAWSGTQESRHLLHLIFHTYGPLFWLEILLPLLAGCATGILSAWGVGGGTLLLLIMTLFLGVDPAAARAVNLLYFLPTAAMGLLTYRKEGLLERPVLTAAVPWGMVAAAVGAWLSTALDADLLRRPFGVFLLVAGVLTLARKEN